MYSIITTDPLALKILMTEDIYELNKSELEVLQTTSFAPEKSQENPNFNYMGENNKYFLFLIREEKAEVISKPDLEALTGILAAKKMDLRDVAVLNYKKYPGIDFSQLKSFFACSKCVLLGINPSDLNLSDVPGNKISVIDGVKVLATFSFGKMQADINKKRVFWNEMKQL